MLHSFPKMVVKSPHSRYKQKVEAKKVCPEAREKTLAQNKMASKTEPHGLQIQAPQLKSMVAEWTLMMSP